MGKHDKTLTASGRPAHAMGGDKSGSLRCSAHLVLSCGASALTIFTNYP